MKPRLHAPKRTLLIDGIGRLFERGRVEQDVRMLIRDGRVAWRGRADESAPTVDDEVVEHLDCGGRAVLPGLVDCHTHLVFGGDRADEFGERSTGVSYERIAARGGGIRSTVRATRQASETELVTLARARLDRMLARGVTCVEVKSGYGLDLDTELKMLRVVAELQRTHPVELVPTLLAAHTVPPEYEGRTESYVEHVVETIIPAVAEAGLARFCDVFCERNVFDVAQARRVLMAGIDAGLRPKVHAEQLHRIGGTQLGVELGAVSVDHLEAISAEDIGHLAGSETVAVLLPGATLFLGMSQWAPARALLDAGVTVALSTDCNPGSSMCDNLPLMTTLGCARLGMSPAEALTAITWGKAAALGLQSTRGHLGVGAAGDCLVLDATDEAQLPYRFGEVRSWAVVCSGDVVVGPGCPSL